MHNRQIWFIINNSFNYWCNEYNSTPQDDACKSDARFYFYFYFNYYCQIHKLYTVSVLYSHIILLREIHIYSVCTYLRTNSLQAGKFTDMYVYPRGNMCYLICPFLYPTIICRVGPNTRGHDQRCGKNTELVIFQIQM